MTASPASSPGRFDGYDRVMGTFREIVPASLKRETAEVIAFGNSWRLMTGRSWLK